MNQLLRSCRIKCKMDHANCLSFVFRIFWGWLTGKIKRSNCGKGRWNIVKTNFMFLQ